MNVGKTSGHKKCGQSVEYVLLFEAGRIGTTQYEALFGETK